MWTTEEPGLTHSGIGTLRGLTHHLHDEVALRLQQE